MPTSRRSCILLFAAAAIAGALPALGRLPALVWFVVVVAAVVSVARSRVTGTSSALLAALVGAGPALVLVGVVHDLLGLTPPLSVSAILLLSVWSLTSVHFGAVVAARVQGPRALADVWSRVVGVAASTGFIAGALIRLLQPSFSTADRLAWTLSEEDNAQIVGIAREVLTGGPRGAELADQYGTAVINLPLMLLRLAGGPLTSEVDLRLQAITVYTVSTIVVIVLAGIAMAHIAALPHHVHAGRRGTSAPGAIAIAIAPFAVGMASLAGFSLLVVLPMRTGFLTFVWGLTLVLLGAAAVAVTPTDAPAPARAVLTAHLLGLLVLLFSSWPFIAPAVAPLFLVPLSWIRWRDARVVVLRRSGLALAGALGVLGALGAIIFWFFRWGPAAEVISYGLDILLIGASEIAADQFAQRTAILAVLGVGLAIVTMGVPHARLALSVSLIGPVVGGGLLYLGLRAAAVLFTDGELRYSGIKLLYGVTALAFMLGLLGLMSQLSQLASPGVLISGLLAFAVLNTSATAALYDSWWARTYAGPQPHSEATVQAIQNSSAGLPIRCLPSPGTAVNSETRWAAYFCARWVEDAFNEGRFGGYRFELLGASGDTFEDTVEDILARSPSEYLFAYRMTMGPGWFGWTGPG
jgi:hypothetical protein